MKKSHATNAANNAKNARTKSFNVAAIRKDFPILSRIVHGKPLIYLDSAATSQKPKAVIAAERRYYERFNANVHRGMHTLSVEATDAYEDARKTVAGFINAAPQEIVFVRNATEAINLVAYAWGRANIRRNDVIVTTMMEHHSNIVPWQELAKEKGAKLRFVKLVNGELDLADFAAALRERPKLVAFTHVSNVLGTINPARHLIKQCHDSGALVLLDACQSVQHMPVDVKQLDADFLVFSGHKLYGPMGIGVLYAKHRLLDCMPPFLTGGEMIREVTPAMSTWNDAPLKFEAGTPNVPGAIGLAVAINYLQSIGMERIQRREQEITAYALEKLKSVAELQILGPATGPRGALVAFVIHGIPPHDIASLLDDDGIAVRSGHHCAMPLHCALCPDGSVRASFGIYTTENEIDALVKGLERCKEVFAR
jgi:cysteine desulfurase/selenocysteine lyase